MEILGILQVIESMVLQRREHTRKKPNQALKIWIEESLTWRTVRNRADAMSAVQALAFAVALVLLLRSSRLVHWLGWHDGPGLRDARCWYCISWRKERLTNPQSGKVGSSTEISQTILDELN